MDKNTCCPICVKEFFKTSNLRRHIKRFHPEAFEPTPKKQFAFTCDVCGKNFSYVRNFKSHKKLHNPNVPSSKTMKNCPLCMFISDKKELCIHFEKTHGIQLATEIINFSSFEHFMTWKLSLENDCNFIRGYSQQTKYYDEVILFVCHRSGHHFSKTKNIRKCKNNAGTKKIGGFCPASIKMMKREDGNIQVFFLKTHVGHSNESVNLNGESNIKSKIINIRHKNSLNLTTDSIVRINDVWHFHSQDQERIVVISRNRTDCSGDCPFTCEDCKACIHRFSCSCKDWSIKWNMCVHIHLLCRALNEEQDLEQQKQDHQPQQLQSSDSNLDITDLIIYDGGRNGQPSSILQEVQVPASVSIEEKNSILSDFSELIIKCNSQSLFQEISTIVEELKIKVECQEILRPSVQNHFSTL